MIEQLASPQNEFGIEVLPFKEFVHIAAVAAHFLGKPRHAVALFAQLRMNHFAKMDFVHYQASRFFCFGRLPDAEIRLSCFVGT